MNRVGIAQEWIVDENRLHQLRPWPARPGVHERNRDVSTVDQPWRVITHVPPARLGECEWQRW